jgi:uncharacterized repeat protein (TIGR02543 family)
MRKILSTFSALLLIFVLVACGSRTYTVTFESNGGSAVAAITDVEKDSTITAPTAPTRANYEFGGWFKDSELTNQWNFATDVVVADITLYAKWNEPSGPTDQEAVDATHTWLTLPDLSALTNSSPRLILPTTYPVQGVAISWVIDKTEYIAANGVITQPTFEEGDQTVTLTATLSKGSVTRTKEFTASVIALPSLEETEPIINETFNYPLGNILDQTTIWGPVSGKSGNSIFTVVDSAPAAIPGGSQALKLEALLELQIEAPIVHAYDLVIIEVDVMQTATSNGSPINIQSSSSSPVVAFGVDGAALFYRTDNGPLMKTDIEVNKWYTLRAEVNLVDKTLEVFYYEDNGQLMSMTPGPVEFTGTTSIQSLFIRSGSSTTTELRPPAYITNIIANRIEAMPRPTELIEIGEITGIRPSVSVEEDGTFTVDAPVVRNLYGTQRELILDTDYTLTIDNPVDTSVAGDYVVTYTFTNLDNPLDTKVVTQEVIVYAVGDPNEITQVVSTVVGYLENTTDITVTTVQPQGDLYYILSSNETETVETIMAGTSVEITGISTLIEDIEVGNNTFIHFVVDLFGESNIVSHTLIFEAVTEIATAQDFITLTTPDGSGVINTSFAIVADLDFTGLVFPEHNASIRGKIYGNGHTLSNITINRTGGNYGGIFPRLNGATVRDLVIDNATITSVDRGGVLVGRVENNDSVVMNIVIMNSSVTAENSNGVGGVIGLVSRKTELSNIAIIDSTVQATGQKNVGGVVGRVDGGLLDAKDIYVNNVTVISTATGTDLAAGGFVGYIRDSLTSVVEAERVVIVGSTVNAVMGGALIGYNRLPGSATINHAYVQVAFTHPDRTHAGLIGRVNDEASYLDQTHIFGSLTGTVEHAQVQNLTNIAIPENQAWWSSNLPVFVDDPLWTFDTNNTYALANYKDAARPTFDVTLIYNASQPQEVIQVREGLTFSYGAPLVEGYNFVGWFTDSEMTIPLSEGYVVTQDVTLYGKYEALPTYDVTFDVDEGSSVDPILGVYEGSMITEPAEPTKDGYTFEGWYKEATFDNLWNFDVDVVTQNTTLYAKWEIIPEVTYNVTFDVDGGSSVEMQVVAEDGLATKPADPTKDGYTFEGWYKEATFDNLWDFDVDTVTEDITLFAKWEEIIPTSISTASEFMAMTIDTSGTHYILENDIDFTGVPWTQTGNGVAFNGVLNGNGFVVSNITITGSGRMGIFQMIDGATIYDLIIVNTEVLNSGGRTGIIAGRLQNNPAILENITIINSKATGTANEGVGGLIGQIANKVTANHIVIVDTVLETTAKNVGFFGGQVLAETNITDFYVYGTTASSANDNTDSGVGAVLGYTNDIAAVVTLDRIVIENSELIGRATGALVGYYNRGSLTASNMFVDLQITYNGSQSQSSGLLGRVGTADNTTPVFTDVFTHLADAVIGTIGVANDPAYDLEDLSGLNQTWWETNLPAISEHTSWSINVQEFYQLAYTVPELDPVEPAVYYTVTFDVDGGSSVSPVQVEENELITEPAEPSKFGYTFEGWFIEATFDTLWDFDVDIVTEDITLYAKWEEVIDEGPVGTAITTIEEFYTIATTGGTESAYYLENDLDFTGYTWTPVNYNFTRALDGNGKSIMNLTINGGDRLGLFSRVNGATITNLTLDNVEIISTGRAGALVGEVDGNNVNIHNVKVINSSVSGNNSNGVGGLLGYTKPGFEITISNVLIQNTTITNAGAAAGGLIGLTDGAAITISDVEIRNVEVNAANRSGGLYGEVKGGAALILNVNRVVISATVNGGQYVAGILGRPSVDGMTMNLSDVVFTGTINASSTNVGHVSGDRNANITNIYMIDITVVGTLNRQVVDAEYIIDTSITTVDDAWWTTNLPNITGSDLWTFNAVSNFYEIS